MSIEEDALDLETRTTGDRVRGVRPSTQKSIQFDEAEFMQPGASSIDDLADVDTTTSPPAPAELLTWDGTNFVPAPPAVHDAHDVTFTPAQPTIWTDPDPTETGDALDALAASILGEALTRGAADTAETNARAAADLTPVPAPPAFDPADDGNSRIQPTALRDYVIAAHPNSNPWTSRSLLGVRSKLEASWGQIIGEPVRACAIGTSLTRRGLFDKLDMDMARIWNRRPLQYSNGHRYFFEDPTLSKGGLAVTPITSVTDADWINSFADAAKGPGSGSILIDTAEVVRFSAVCDGLTIYHLQGQAQDYTVAIDGGGATAVDTATTFKYETGQLSYAEHTFVITASGNDVNLYFVYIHEGNVLDGWQFYNLGAGGSTTQNYLDNQTTFQFMEDVGMDLVIYATGVNDVSDNEYETDMQAMITEVRSRLPNISELLFVEHSHDSDTDWGLRRDRARELAQANNIALVDSFAMLVKPFDETAYEIALDAIHLTPRGNHLVSDMVLPMVSPSVTPRFASLPASTTPDLTNPLTLMEWELAAWADDPAWTPPADGAAVSAWRTIGRSMLGAESWLRQATAGAQPLYRATGWGGATRPSIEFDGTNDFLATGVGEHGATFTFSIIVACKLDTVTNVFRNVVGHGASTQVRGIGKNNNASSPASSWYMNAGTALNSNTAADTGEHVLVGVFAGSGTSELELDGTVIASGAGGASAQFYRAMVGCTGNTTPSAFWDGHVHFVGFYRGDIRTDPMFDRVHALIEP